MAHYLRSMSYIQSCIQLVGEADLICPRHKRTSLPFPGGLDPGGPKRVPFQGPRVIDPGTTPPARETAICRADGATWGQAEVGASLPSSNRLGGNYYPRHNSHHLTRRLPT